MSGTSKPHMERAGAFADAVELARLLVSNPVEYGEQPIAHALLGLVEQLEAYEKALKEIRSWRGMYHGPERMQEIAKAVLAEKSNPAKRPS